MSIRLKSLIDPIRCELCYHWTPTEESDSFVVFRDGVEKKIIFGICNLKGSEPDSECTCSAWEKNIEVVDEESIRLFSKAMKDGQEALIHFRTTNDRSKFKEWLEKYNDLKIGG